MAVNAARAIRRLQRRRPPWMAALRVTLAGSFDWKESLKRFAGGIRSRAGLVLMGVLAVGGVLGAEVAFFMFFRALHAAMLLAGQPLGLPLMVVLGSQVMAFVIGTAMVISSLFFSRDVPRLMALPLRPAEIMGARFAALYNDMLGIFLLLLAPALVAAGSLPTDPAALPRAQELFDAPLRLRADPLYWLAGVWLWLTLPAAPLGLAALVGVTVGRVVPVSRYRDALYVLGGLLGLAAAVGYQYVNVRLVPSVTDPSALAELLARPNALVMRWAQLYPTARWAAEALMGPAGWRLARLGAFTLVSVAAMLPAFWLAQRWYLQGVQAGLEERADRRRRGRTEGEGAETARQVLARGEHAPVVALALREWRLLWRTPPFMMAAVGNAVVPPLIVAMLAVVSPGELGAAVSALKAEWVAAGIAGLAIFMTGANQVAATSVSREGSGFPLVAALPATPAQQVAARLLVAVPFALVGLGLVVAAAWWVVRPPAGALWIGAAVGLVGCWPAMAGSLWVDLLRPVTRWDNPQQAMKGNVNGLWSMLVSVGLLAAGGGVGWLVLRWWGDMRWALAAAGVVLALLGAALTRLCLRQAEATFASAGELGD